MSAAPDFPEEWTRVALDAFMAAAQSGSDNVGALNAIIAALAPLISARRAEAILDAVCDAQCVVLLSRDADGGMLLVDGGVYLSREDLDYALSTKRVTL